MKKIHSYFALMFLVSFFILHSPRLVSADLGIISVPFKDKTGRQVGLYKESHALIIGVSDYTDGWPDLPGVENDIKRVRETLEAHGFHVVVVLNPTRSEILAAYEDFINRYGLETDDRLLFYFAGHGHTLKASYGGEMGYIVPRNAPNPNIDKAGFLSRAVNMEQIETFAKRIQSKHALFLFDSCFAGTIFALSREIPENISYKTNRPVRQFITAGSAHETVPDESIFSAQFVQALKGAADSDKDGYLTGIELGEFLQKKVVNYSNGTQHPQYGNIRDPHLDKGDFVFSFSIRMKVEPNLNSEKNSSQSSLKGPQESSLRKKLREAKRRSERLESEFALLKEMDRMENYLFPASDKIQAWKEFLDKFPDRNPMTNEARKKLAALQIDLSYEEAKKAQANTRSPENRIKIWKDFLGKNKGVESHQKIIQAKAQLKTLELAADYERLEETQKNASLSENESKAQLENFLKKYGDREQNPTVISVRKTLASLTQKKPSPRLIEKPEKPKKLIEPEQKPEPSVESEEEQEMKMAAVEPQPLKPDLDIPTEFEDMVLIQAGEFQMGSAQGDGDEGPVHTVYLGAYYIDKYEVTQKDFVKVMGINPSEFKSDDRPVDTVNWEEAREYCRKIGKRLPTEAEWEKAARAGTTSKYGWGDDPDDSFGWWQGQKNTSGNGTHPVGKKNPNKNGIYDMAGNVWEWVDDWYSETYYQQSPNKNPQGPSTGEEKVLRGGAWDEPESRIRSSNRYSSLPPDRYSVYGFRCTADASNQ